MNMKISNLICVFLLVGSSFSQNNVCFTIQANPLSSDPALGVFSKYVDVYGCGIYAESTIPDDKVLHAAAIWAELIDNDEDGVIDDPALHTELVNNSAIMPIFESDGNPAMVTFMNNYNGNGVSAVLWKDEIDPTQPGHWGADATIEEILHTINGVGHVNIYPNAFNLAPNSSLMSAAMDAARGGQFLSVPPSYPTDAWYHYDDQSCDYECMAIEYMYWSIVSLMGILDDPSTCSGISNEWELCSPTLFENTDTLMYNIITDGTYKLPQLAPDGNYCLTNGINELASSASFNLFPNPTNEIITIKRHTDTPTSICLYNMLGELIMQSNINSKQHQINTENLPSGVYTIVIDHTSLRLIKE